MEKRTEILLLVTFWNQFFSVIQRKYILNDWKIDHCVHSKLKKRFNFQT